MLRSAKSQSVATFLLIFLWGCGGVASVCNPVHVVEGGICVKKNGLDVDIARIDNMFKTVNQKVGELVGGTELLNVMDFIHSIPITLEYTTETIYLEGTSADGLTTTYVRGENDVLEIQMLVKLYPNRCFEYGATIHEYLHVIDAGLRGPPTGKDGLVDNHPADLFGQLAIEGRVSNELASKTCPVAPVEPVRVTAIKQ